MKALCAAEFRGACFESPVSSLGSAATATPPVQSSQKQPLVWLYKVASAVGSGVLHVLQIVLRSKDKVAQQVLRQRQLSGMADGDMVLKELGIPDSSVHKAHVNLGRMIAAHCLLALIGLVASKHMSN